MYLLRKPVSITTLILIEIKKSRSIETYQKNNNKRKNKLHAQQPTYYNRTIEKSSPLEPIFLVVDIVQRARIISPPDRRVMYRILLKK